MVKQWLSVVFQGGARLFVDEEDRTIAPPNLHQERRITHQRPTSTIPQPPTSWNHAILHRRNQHVRKHRHRPWHRNCQKIPPQIQGPTTSRLNKHTVV